MAKIQPLKPFLMLLYGYPGSGKTYFARQFSENVVSAHLQADRIRSELFEDSRYDKQENTIVTQLMNYMCEEFLAAGLSVVYDTNALRSGQRKALYAMAHRYHVTPIIIWFQMDVDTAFYRNYKRDRRKADDKYAAAWDRTTFESYIGNMQNPKISENYLVVSGKHVFNMQQSAVIAKLRNMGVLSSAAADSKVTKPGMVNLVPNLSSGRVDLSRRNISIR
ncbi:MAG TPA: ATP-binding protein [Candidatus Sulfotelmatobacter sp.]|nr:ATP-binding protein [Candidatus Sulfotelmatobacter sp.]